MIRKELINIKNTGGQCKTERLSFSCLKVIISANDPFMDRIWEMIETMNMNTHSANTGLIRTEETVTSDKLIGLIAEYICYQILMDELGNENIIKPPSNTSRDQIDIKTFTDETIEVRSSCIRNGIEFALFNVNFEGMQYIDIVGPYYNPAYKTYENIKDYYMRVIYEGDTSRVAREIKNGQNIILYITGGATKQMLLENGYLKYMTAPDDSSAEKKGKYLVVPMSKSLDYPEFIDNLKYVMR